MGALILDAGALIAIDRGDRHVLAQIDDADRAGDRVRTNAMAVAQAWRDGKGRQAELARAPTESSRVIPATCGHCAARLGTRPWWSAADRA